MDYIELINDIYDFRYLKISDLTLLRSFINELLMNPVLMQQSSTPQQNPLTACFPNTEKPEF
jgi:hypothetical protein